MRNKIFDFKENIEKEVKEYSILFCTDFYQISMTAAYIFEERANEEVVFESFVRNIRGSVDSYEERYIFSGEEKVKAYLEECKNDMTHYRDKMLEDFVKFVTPKVEISQVEKYIAKISREWNKLDTDFEFHILKEGSLVKPFVPVFQYKGPRWFGQMIETMVVNIINGRTGYETYKKNGYAEKGIIEELKYLTFDFDDLLGLEENQRTEAINVFKKYEKALQKRADEYRNITEKTIIEAGFRRAPGVIAAILASITALDRGWSGTSNTTTYYYGIEIDKIGGSCAHSFIMSYENEVDAFKIWLNNFAGSTLLIDTYDVFMAAEKIVKNNLKPAFVRIDSEPLGEYAKGVKEIFDRNGRSDIGIFISSDITPEMIEIYNNNKIPFDRVMAGTKYVNCADVEKINCGFVYKLVVNNINGKNYFPEKKASFKKNYTGYKQIFYYENKIEVKKSDRNIGFSYKNKARDNSEVSFVGFE